MPNELSTIQNPESSEYVSHMLELLAQNLAGSRVSTEVTRTSVPDKKTSLIIEIAVGLGVTATWEVLRFVVASLKSSRNPSPDEEFVLNGKRYKVTEIDEKKPDAKESDETSGENGQEPV